MDSKRGKRRAPIVAESDDSGNDGSARGKTAVKRRSPAKPVSSAKRRKKARPEGMSDEEDEDESDEDYMGGDALLPEEAEERRERKRGSSSKRSGEPRRKVRLTLSFAQLTRQSETKSSGKSSVEASLQRARTRALCVDSLRKALEPLLAKVRGLDAHDFAEEVEHALFKEHAEPEPNGQRGPKQKYMAKFRALSYNLKSNEPFRQRIARKELDAQAVATMAPEDLLSAEQRAMADAVREQSMRASVKQVDEAPTARQTHKGMEVIESSDAFATVGREMPPPISIPSRRDSSGSGMQMSPPPPLTPASGDEMQLDHSPTVTHSPRVGQSPQIPASPATSDREGSNRPEARRSVSINLDSVWGASTAAPTSGEGTPAGEGGADEYNPVSATHGDDRDYDDILHGDASGPSTSAARPAAPVIAGPELTDLDPVWFGPVHMPDEGTFPAVGVQVAGRNLGLAAETWQEILPPQLNMAGRLPVKTASDYLVQNTFTQTRELIILALVPDQSGPSAAEPNKPTAAAAIKTNDHLIHYFSSKQRYGVAPPPRHLRFVRDTYIVPLKRDDPMPEFIDLLDSHLLGERPRPQDVLLAVLVLQRGLVPLAVAPPSPPPPPPPSSMAVPAPAPASALTPEMAAALAALAGGTTPQAAPPPQIPSQDALQGLLSSLGTTPPQPPSGPPMNAERAAMLAKLSRGY